MSLVLQNLRAPLGWMLLGLALSGCVETEPKLSASHVCGESIRPASGATARQTLVLTDHNTGQFPDRDLRVLWLCNAAELCDPVFSYDQARAVVAHWVDAETIEIVSDADAPHRWPAPAPPRNAPWPEIQVKLVKRDKPDSPPLEHHLSAGEGPILGVVGVVCRPIRDFTW